MTPTTMPSTIAASLPPVVPSVSPWEPSGPPGHEHDYLLATATLYGVPHHLEAIRVEVLADGTLRPYSMDDSLSAARWQNLHRAFEALTPDAWRPVRIAQRLYVLFLEPYHY